LFFEIFRSLHSAKSAAEYNDTRQVDGGRQHWCGLRAISNLGNFTRDLEYATQQCPKEYPADQGRKMPLHPHRVPGHLIAREQGKQDDAGDSPNWNPQGGCGHDALCISTSSRRSAGSVDGPCDDGQGKLGPLVVLRSNKGVAAAEPAKAPRNPLRTNRFMGLRSAETSSTGCRKSSVLQIG
jgi:hypothetical protein